MVRIQNHKNNQSKLNGDNEIAYRHRVMTVLITVLVVSILLVRFWPVEEKSIKETDDVTFQDEVMIQQIEITRQESAPPPPPKPQLPEPVPNDEIIEEVIDIEIEQDFLDAPELPSEQGTGMTGDENTIVSNPQLAPTVRKIVEPHVPDLPEELRGRIEMIVNFLVDQEGNVEEASIIQIRKYDESYEEYEVLPYIQYGLINTTIDAALQWKFRPARHQGSGVKTYTSHRFNY